MIGLTRTCIKCGETKHVRDFPPEPKMESGRSVKCYQCTWNDMALYESKCQEKNPVKRRRR